MIGSYEIRTVALVAIAVALLTPVVSVADNQAERDTREVSSYVLTEAGLAKFAQAVHNLGQLAKTLPGACDDSEDAKSLNDMAARMDAIPKVKAAMKSAGISSHEYLVFSMSLLQTGVAAWALDQPGGKLSPGTQIANVKFYRAHDAALEKLGKETKADDCDDGDRASESEQ